MKVEQLVRYIADKKLNRVRPSGEELVAACPFHKGGMEKHPSFSISLQSGKWICFSCGEAGDIHSLATRFGISDLAKDIKREPYRPKKQEDTYLPLGILGVFHHLPKILLDFGFSKDTLRDHDIGFDKRPEYMRYTFPVISRDNKLRIISGRSLYGWEPKYLVYQSKHFEGIYQPYGYEPKKSRWLWREDKLVPDKPIILAEGFKAGLWLAQSGLNSCAMMGTYLSNEQAKTIRDIGAGEVYIFLDNDGPGIKGTRKVYRTLLKHGVTNVKIANYPPGNEDNSPDDLSEDEIAYALLKSDNYGQFLTKHRYTLNAPKKQRSYNTVTTQLRKT